MFIWIGLLSACAGRMPTPQATLERMGGCFIVDYNFHEQRALAEGYARDERVYDVNAKSTVYEWIAFSREGDAHFRLQHVLFARDAQGKLKDGSMLRHQAEDWESAAKSRFAYVGPGEWKQVSVAPDTWLRRVTDLDDGLRYQCAAPWDLVNAERAEWKCQDLAPIPGRETRDMKRKDYDTLDRVTHIVAFPRSGAWVERQDNVKIAAGQKLAAEVGRNWYVRVPDEQCQEAKAFADAREQLWRLSRLTWAEYLSAVETYRTSSEKRGERFAGLAELEKKWVNGELGREDARRALQALIAQP